MPSSNYVCEDCGRPYQVVSSLRRHEREVHGQPEVYKCPHCQRPFLRRYQMRTHSREFCPDRPVQIECHQKHGEDRLPRINRDDDELSPFSSDSFVRDGAGWVPRNTGYRCVTCEARYMALSSLKRHTREKHLYGKRYKCPTCSGSFERMYQLEQHMDQCQLLKSTRMLSGDQGREAENENDYDEAPRLSV